MTGLTRVEEASVPVEDSHGSNGPNTAEAMDLRDVERVINFEAGNQLLGLTVNKAADHSDDGSSPELDVVAAGSNRDHAGKYRITQRVHVVVVHDLTVVNLLFIRENIADLVQIGHQKT